MGAGAVSREAEEQTVGVQSAAGDQLVENGLSSPLCDAATAASLSASSRSDCASSQFVAAAAPSNDYGLDVHIDTGAFGLSRGGLLAVVQDVLIAPVWGALEWLVHALVVLLEWAYTLELLGGAGASTVARALLQARAGFTEPWLALILALASLLTLYQGLVRRRVADTLGGALTMLAMMAGGLWVIADPSGTVGAIGGWADQASLETLATTASGTPTNGQRTLADSMRALYAATIETPWCYLEFGNVRWCNDPSRLDPRLRAAALALATGKERPSAPPHAAQLVRAASTNGALFLAYPANGPQRNSINQEGSLLRAVCRSEEATKCIGPAAAEAEFRTGGGTFPRLLGLLAIAAGVLGMALLFGLLALRLLAAAFVGLFLLLLAPLAVLAPAFGDGGRALFTSWLTRLLAAVTSKLLFSFVLGALLTMQRALSALDTLGWWTQWLLISGFWWTLFVKRHELAAMLQGAAHQGPSAPGPRRQRGGGSHLRPVHGGASGGPAGGGGRSLPLLRQAESALQTYGSVRHPRRWVQEQVEARLAQRPPRDLQPPAVLHARHDSRPLGARLRAGASRLGRGGGPDRRGLERAQPPASVPRRSDGPEQLDREHRQHEHPRRAHRQPPAPDREGGREGVDGRGASPSPAVSAQPSGQPSQPPPTASPPRTRGIAAEERSPVMEDAFAVMHGRKRRLGYGPER